MTTAAAMTGGRARRREAILAHLVRHPDRPISAVELADAAGIPGLHETKRRRVRELIRELREQGRRVCAGSGHDTDCGLWLARDDAEWRAYLESRRSMLRFEFAELSRTQRAASERGAGQGTLFETRSVVV